MKPIKFERFVKAVNKAIPTSLTPIGKEGIPASEPEPIGKDSFLYFRADRKMVKIFLKDILYVESLKDYVKIYTMKGQVVTKYSMAALEAMLPSPHFMRIHRSFIIAIDRLNSYTANHIQLHTTELPIGKLHQREVFKILEKR